MSGGPVFVEKVDVEAMASYMAARWISEGDEEIWHNDLSEDDRNAWRRVASEAIDAALVGVRPAEGSRVAGPDDLLIRREDIDYEAAAELVAFRIGSVLQDGHEKQGACVMCRKDARDIVDAALAAAEGGEE